MSSFLPKVINRVSWKIWLFFLAVSQSLYVLMLSFTIPFIRAEAGNHEIFDLRPFGYSVADARDFLSHLSQAGHAMYTRVQLPLDFVFPLSLAAMLSCSWILLNRLNLKVQDKTPEMKTGGILTAAAAFPFFVMFCDYSENCLIALMLHSVPDRIAVLAPVASVFSVMKSMSTVCIDILLVSFLLVVAVRKAVKAVRRGKSHD
jgi:hypothetical protein